MSVIRVPRGEPRVHRSLPVELVRRGRRHMGLVQDLSHGGLFMRTDADAAVGEVVALGLHAPSGARLWLSARVAHRLAADAARDLGRHPGLGFALTAPESEATRPFHALLTELEGQRRHVPFATQVLVVDPSPRLLERMTTALREVGFSVEGAFDGADACTACLERPPDIAVVADEMPGIDGWTVAETIKSRTRLSDTLVLITSESPDDVMRLRAYHLGVAEILPKPFTEEELGLRMERLSMLAHRRETGRVMLRGNLADLRMHSLLTLLDFEQKSAILMVRGPDGTAKISVNHGRVARVESSIRTDGAFAALREILDWEEGHFELVAADVRGKAELDMPTAAILIEHERLKDEAR